MKKNIFFIIIFILFSLFSGILYSYTTSINKHIFETDQNFLDVPIEFTDTYLGPADKRWTAYVDNPLPQVIHHGKKTNKKIALTFDDGPRPGSTEKILEILRDHNIKATFFIVGKQAEKYPHLIQRIYDEGHEIGNHTYSHKRLTKMSNKEIIEDVEKTRTVIFNQIGFIPYLFRPPGGKFNSESLGILKELNYSIVFWTNNSGDWMQVEKNILSKRVIKNTKPGTIILMHNSNYSSTLESLPEIISNLENQHYRFVTISKLI